MYLLYCTLRQVRNYCRKNIISTLHIFSVATNQTSIDQIEHENLIYNNCTFQTENLLDYCNPKKCLFVFFEDLQKDLISEMTVVLKFLGFDMNSGTESCLLSFTNDNFKRERRPDFEIKEILKMFTSEEIHSFEMAYMKIKNGLKFEAVKQKVL